MFLDELSPFAKELLGHPVAFLGGFVSGVLRLNLNDEPVKQWIEQQGGSPGDGGEDDGNSSGGGGPQTISIE